MADRSITVNIDLETTSRRELRKMIRLSMESGFLIEEIAEQSKLSIDEINEILSQPPAPSNRIIRCFEQIACPFCGTKILSPEATFNKNDEIGRIKHGYTYCYNCMSPLEVYTPKEGRIAVMKIETVKKVSLVSGGGSQIGIQLTTDVYLRQVRVGREAWEARVGIAIFGSVNFKECIDMCPFDPNFHDNYAKGEGITEQQALEILKAELESIKEGLL